LASSCADMLVLSFARTTHMSRNCLKVSFFTLFAHGGTRPGEIRDAAYPTFGCKIMTAAELRP
jgi:hypothetical protein